MFKVNLQWFGCNSHRYMAGHTAYGRLPGKSLSCLGYPAMADACPEARCSGDSGTVSAGSVMVCGKVLWCVAKCYGVW